MPHTATLASLAVSEGLTIGANCERVSVLSDRVMGFGSVVEMIHFVAIDRACLFHSFVFVAFDDEVILFVER